MLSLPQRYVSCLANYEANRSGNRFNNWRLTQIVEKMSLNQCITDNATFVGLRIDLLLAIISDIKNQNSSMKKERYLLEMELVPH